MLKLIAYFIDVVVHIMPIFLKKHVVFLCFFTIIKENYNLLLQRKCLLKLRFKKVWFVKTRFPEDAKKLKKYVKIVKINMVNLNVTIFNRCKIMGLW